MNLACMKKSHFDDHGFAIVGGGDLRQRVLEARANILKIMAGLFGPAATLEDAFAAAFSAGVEEYLAVVRILGRFRSIRRLVLTTEISAFLMDKLGYECPMEPSEAVIHVQSDQLRIPGGYFGTLAHQDMSAFGGYVPKLSVIWIPLVDVTPDNFALELADGMHTQGLFRSIPANQVYAIPPGDLPDAAFRPIEMKVGEAVVMSGYMPHRSGPGAPNAFRLAFSYRVVEACDRDFFIKRFQYTDPGAKKV